MRKTEILIIFGIVSALIINGTFYAALADHSDKNDGKWYQKFMHDHDDDEKGEHHRKKHRNHEDCDDEDNVIPSLNPNHIEACGSCHWAYPAALLPAGSWEKILAGLEDHFGTIVDLNPESKNAVSDYLKTNAADYSKRKLSLKIIRSLGNQTPLRITEVPYIQKEHHEIKPDVFKRESIGSFSNCLSCHVDAQKGIFDDDHVEIPQ